MHQANKKRNPSAHQAGGAFAWHHIRGVVPADWEITAYSLESLEGRLEFNSRRGLEAVVRWEPSRPELDRRATMATSLTKQFTGKERKLRPDDIITAEIGPFLVGWLDETLPCQALGYKTKSGHLIRWIFEGHASKANREKIVRPILESCDFNQDEAICEYNVSGIHCTLPWDYKIKDVALLPADVMMSFESDASQRRAIFRRWGLAERILSNQTLASFYTAILSTQGIIVDTSAPCRVDTWDALRLVFNAAEQPGSERAKRRRWHNGIAIIWYDKEANRIYAFEQIGPEATETLDFNASIPECILKDPTE